MFIVFEGIDGAGKTTQIELLADKLRGAGFDPYITAEPTGMETGKAIRRVLSGAVPKTPTQVAAMFVQDRIDHNVDPEQGIEVLLAQGKAIICDRYYYSSLAYQGSLTDFDWVMAANCSCPEIRRPDLCIFLDLSPEESMKRITKGRTQTEIYEKADTLTKVRARYMDVFQKLSARGEQIEIIDASGNIEQTAEAINAAIKKHFDIG
ncbi:MAG: dTMP kinase [Clostridia bacterium]|nr:dTMP kinase [Clostridia bacterium]